MAEAWITVTEMRSNSEGGVDEKTVKVQVANITDYKPAFVPGVTGAESQIDYAGGGALVVKETVAQIDALINPV